MEEEMMYFQELIEFFKVKEAYKVDGMIEFGMEDFKKLQSLLNRLEQLEKENKELKEQIYIHEIFPPSELELKLKDSIPKSVIRDKFKRINETKIKLDKINARNYMIFGDTDRATGWFINVDYIEKILLDIPGYKIEEK